MMTHANLSAPHPPLGGHPGAGMGYNNGQTMSATNNANLTVLGQHSGHAPDHRRNTKLQEYHHASSRAVLTSTSQAEATYLSPVPVQRKTHSGRPSLVGFDPLLSNGLVSASPARKTPALAETLSTPATKSVTLAPKSKMLTPQVKRTNNKNQHRRGAQSLGATDLRSISQDASVDEPEKRSNNNSREPSPTPGHGTARIPSTPTKTKEEKPVSKVSGKISPSANRKENSLFGAKKVERRSSAPKTPPKGEQASDKKGATSVTPPKSRKLPWAKKGHRRTRSLETEVPALVPKPSFMASNEAEQRKSSMYPSIVKDMMALSVQSLQMPSLAKPSPTSFLTGREEEVVRTVGHEAAPFQMDIPMLPEFIVAARLNEFVENYRRLDQNFDLADWVGSSRMDLRQVKIPQHLPIAQSLLECGDDVCLQGVVSKGSDADNRVEAVVFEGQRQFVVVFRGTTEQQTKPANNMMKKKTIPLLSEQDKPEVYQCFFDECQKVEAKCIALLDKLTEEHPFCDVVFTGHSFGAAMATLAAFRYANARPTMRVSCYPMGSPKVGSSQFRYRVNTLPNLKMLRLEFGQDGKCQLPGTGGAHVGHTLVLHGSLGHNSLKSSQPVLAYKFDTPKHKKFKTTHPDLRSYVVALEEVARLNLPWVKDFVGNSGKGVVVNNEKRLVV